MSSISINKERTVFRWLHVEPSRKHGSQHRVGILCQSLHACCKALSSNIKFNGGRKVNLIKFFGHGIDGFLLLVKPVSFSLKYLTCFFEMLCSIYKSLTTLLAFNILFTHVKSVRQNGGNSFRLRQLSKYTGTLQSLSRVQ